MEEEIWKDIPEYEYRYQISTFGRVRSLKRIVAAGSGHRLLNDLILKPRVDSGGYKTVGLFKYERIKTYRIHQLSAIVFLGHNPSGSKVMIDHKDGDKSNNNINNLHIVTGRENGSTCFRKRSSSFSSQYVGVCWHKLAKKWYSSIRINGKSVYLGSFATEIEASNSYQNKLSKI